MVTNLTSPENPREMSVSNPKDIVEPKPLLPGQTAKTMGITKLKPAATTISHAEAGPSEISSATIPLRSRSTLGQVQSKKYPVTATKKGKDKPARMTPVEYAEMLIEKHSNPNRKIPNVSQHLRGRKIFYVGVDMRYAGDATKKKMEYVRTPTTPKLALVIHPPAPDSQAWGHASP
jgi:DNA polymerase lambda